MSCYYLVKTELIPLKKMNDFSTQLSVPHQLGIIDPPPQLARMSSLVSCLVTSRAVMSAIFFCHYLAVILVGF